MTSTYPAQVQPVIATTVALAPAQSTGTRPGYNASTSKCLGATQIAIGVSCFLLQIVAIAIHASLSAVGHGIWCGLFFILVGSFGVVAGQRKRTGFIITFMVLSIISATVFVVPLLTCASIGLSFDNEYWSHHYPYTPPTNQPLMSAKRTMNGLMIGLALLEGIIAIISASICCGPLCCPGGSQGAVHVPGQLQYNQATGQQVIVMNVPQGGSVVQQYPQAAPVTYVQQAPPGIQPGQVYTPQPPPAAAMVAQSTHEPTPPAYNPDMMNPPPYQEKI